MVLFGNIEIKDKVYYNGTRADEMMNYVCGGVLIAYLALGICLNSQIIYFYKTHRTSWIDRYLFFISIARLVYVVTSCIPLIYQFLNSLPPNQITKLEKWLIPFQITSYLSAFGLIALDSVTVAIQYGNIHCPLWTLLNGPFKLMKYVLLSVGSVFVALFAAGIVYGQMNRIKENFSVPLPHEMVIKTAISNAAFILLAIMIITIYVVTWARFWYQTREFYVAQIVRREFKLVTMLAVSDVMGSASFAVFVANLAMLNKHNVGRGIYIWCFSSTIFPLTLSTIIAIYLTLTEARLGNTLLGYQLNF